MNSIEWDDAIYIKNSCEYGETYLYINDECVGYIECDDEEISLYHWHPENGVDYRMNTEAEEVYGEFAAMNIDEAKEEVLQELKECYNN